MADSGAAPIGPALAAFLEAEDWSAASARPLAGDASSRRYWRLQVGARRAILMQAPPAPDDNTARFAAVAAHLGALGLSVPRVLAGRPEEGMLLLEDLGDALVARLAEADPAGEAKLYAAAIDTLAALHGHPPLPSLPHPGPVDLAGALAPLATWYLEGDEGAAETLARLAAALAPPLADALTSAPPVLVHRDYHAENLIWLPERTGPAQIGLLDFQDAMTGHPAYDIASLLRDARRDLAPSLPEVLIERYLAATGLEAAPFRAALAGLSVQRNLRILGIFARLARRDGKRRYLAMLPRVWAHLQTDLAHPSMETLRETVAAGVPAPGPAHLSRLCPEAA